MKRFRVILFLMGGIAISTPLWSKDVIRSSRVNGNSVFNQKLSEAKVFRPGSMDTTRGERFQKRPTLPKFSMTKKKGQHAKSDVRIVTRQSKKTLREFAVVNLAMQKRK